MSATTPKSFVSNGDFTPILLTAVNNIYYTVPTGTKAILKQITLRNTTSVPVRVYVYLVPNGQTAGASNEIFSNLVSGKKSTPIFDHFNATMDAGATIQAYADSASAVNFFASGNEIVS